MSSVDLVMGCLDASKSPFHVVDLLARILSDGGYREVQEQNPQSLVPGGKYFVRRNGSSFIAFRIPKAPKPLFKLASCHTDSPCFKLKPNPVLVSQGLIRLDVEPYGGMIMSTWMDRPLSMAGRVLVETKKGVETRLISFDSDLMTIPNVAIHMNRNVNSGYAYNPAVDMMPILGEAKPDFDFSLFLLQQINDPEVTRVISHDLFLYVRETAHHVGINKEFVSSPKLDDLSSLYSVALAFLHSKGEDSIDVFAAFDNEEVGSLTRQGANSTFLKDTLRHISLSIFGKEEAFNQGVASGFHLSVDNAHANHPNHPELSDPTTSVRMNRGIVLKYNASQKYTTDALSAAVVKKVAELAKVGVQEYTNRSDMPGGSTLGNISNSEVSFLSADIGMPQLAMHSAMEICGAKDIDAMVEFIEAYYNCRFERTDHGFLIA
ncbi:MAG: M18 family aminopeptidase [Candidatus Enteromonas sp.]|nr:M18 family aminopeptidase [Candidatus Enteromonas sp.]